MNNRLKERFLSRIFSNAFTIIYINNQSLFHNKKKYINAKHATINE